MDLINKVYYFLIYTNVLIAIAAVTQCALTYFIFESAVNPYVIAIEGASTLLLYNLSLYFSKPAKPLDSPYRRTRWVFSNEWLLWFNSGCAVIVMIYSVLNIHFYSVLFLIFVAVLTLAYAIPFISYRGQKVGLRQLPAIKVFHIALVWTLSSVCFPAVDLYFNQVTVEIHFLMSFAILKFLFIVICTLPFDIRDIKQDSYYRLRTLPNILGVSKAQDLCYYLLFFHSVGLVFIEFRTEIKVGLLLTNLCIAVALKLLVFEKRGHYHYVYLLDFALILQFALALWSVYLLA